MARGDDVRVRLMCNRRAGGLACAARDGRRGLQSISILVRLSLVRELAPTYMWHAAFASVPAQVMTGTGAGRLARAPRAALPTRSARCRRPRARRSRLPCKDKS